MRRHDMVFIRPTSWYSILERHEDLENDPLVSRWADRGWPLVARRSSFATSQALTLGLPLPPSAGKRRHAFSVQLHDIAGVASPPTLAYAARVAPKAWWPALLRLDALASANRIDLRVFGSLAWSAITGLDYLTASSDLDVLMRVGRRADLDRLSRELAAIELAAPMRIDGELVRDDDVAVNWREFHSGSRDVLVKSLRGVTVVDRGQFAREGLSA